MKSNFKFRFAILAITILMSASNAKADVTAGMLLKYCRVGQATKAFAYCAGYVTGFMSNISITSNRKGMKVEPDHNLYFELMRPCMPRGTQVADVVEILVRYFTEWKSKMDRPASLVLMEALHRRYPCENGI